MDWLASPALAIGVAAGIFGVTVVLGLVVQALTGRPEAASGAEPAAPTAAAAASPVVAAPPVAASAGADYASGLARTRAGFVARLDVLLRGRAALDPSVLDEIESLLFGADLGVRTAEEMMQTVRDAASLEEIRPALESRAREILESVSANGRAFDAKPYVVLMVGVNGAGKTTSIGKLAARWTAEGKKVLLGAADTFRAAAIDQLGIWAERAGAEIVRGEPGGDPASVAFDAVQTAVARGFDVVVIDTAGRMQTDAGLMDEVTKIVRVIRKQLPDAPHEVLLALDANTGQNAIRQAQEFTAAVDVSSIVLSKLDGTAKGGVVLGIARELGIPVRYVGMGEQVGDLYDFDAAAFAEALFARDDA
ncbi:MAG: signal recognition particle-docking protein FtsY [Deltaproteobacteria bacterium]|nr:signal recognition particle-docking protein FtsY [Deltaproteobacteria bacterium]